MDDDGTVVAEWAGHALVPPTDLSDEDMEALKERFRRAQAAPSRLMHITTSVTYEFRPWWRRALARCYLRVRLVTDKALVDRWCIHTRTYGHDLYLWARATTDPWWRVRVTLLEREDF